MCNRLAIQLALQVQPLCLYIGISFLSMVKLKVEVLSLCDVALHFVQLPTCDTSPTTVQSAVLHLKPSCK